MTVGKKLATLRGTKTQEEVAKACDISVSALSMYEQDERTPRDEVKIRLASYYGVSIESLFFAKDNHEREEIC